MSRSAWTRVVKVAAVAAVLWFVARRLGADWAAFTERAGALRPDWMLVALSGVVVFASYAVLIWTWRYSVTAWGEQLGMATASRIWFVSNLGRYVPGKIWQIGAMGVMAQRAGVSPMAAVGSSLMIAVVNVVAGLAVAGLAGAGALGAGPEAVAIGVAGILGLAALPWVLPHAGRLATVLLRREVIVPALPFRVIATVAGACVLAWVLYGMAFRVFHVALLGEATGDAVRSTAAFTSSYLAGFLFLPAPGGIGVREGVLERALSQFGIATGGAAWLVVLGSRIWLTLLEIAPGLILLAAGRGNTPNSSPPGKA